MGAGLIQTVVILLVFMLAFGFFTMYPRIITKDKALCWFLDGTKSAKMKLLKVVDDFVTYGDDGDRYGVDSYYVRNVRYPMGWPSFLQVTVPCVIYEVGRFEPLDWMDLGESGASAKEVGAVLDPIWLSLIVKGTKAGQIVQDRTLKILLVVSVGMSGLAVLLAAYLITKIGSIEGAIADLMAP